MKQIICIIALFVASSTFSSVSAQVQAHRFYFFSGVGYTFPNGSNSYLGLASEFNHGLTLEAELRRSKKFIKTGEAEYWRSAGDFSRIRAVSLSIGKAYPSKKGFGVFSVGATLNTERFGEGTRFLLISNGSPNSVQEMQNWGGQVSWRNAWTSGSIGSELKVTYNVSENYSALQLSWGVLLGKIKSY